MSNLHIFLLENRCGQHMVKLSLSYVCKKEMTHMWVHHAFSAMKGFDVSVLARKQPSADLAFTFFTFVCVRSCKSECGVLVGGNMKEKPLHLWPVLQKPSPAFKNQSSRQMKTWWVIRRSCVGIREREAERWIRARGRRAAGIPHVLLCLAW